jgi:hypothetical protein
MARLSWQIVSGLLAVAVWSSSATAQGISGPSANGHGTRMTGDEESISFSARQRIDGAILGHVTYHDRTTGQFITLEVTCLTVVGNTAWISGRVIHSRVPEFPSGTFGFMEVQDNGEGESNSLDLISSIFLGDFDVCPQTVPLPMTPVLDGNVQVRP